MKRAGFLAVALLVILARGAFGTDYEVGPGRAHTELGTVPWEGLNPGDTVRIHWRSSPYRTKFVLCRQGTQAMPITVTGIPDASGARPVISGENATTPSSLNFWNEERAVIKIGGANTPADTMPQWIVVEHLDIRSARPAFTYTGDDAATHSYASNAAAITVEKGENIFIRNCELHDCGNGLFCAWQSSDILVAGCYIHQNGIVSSIYEHNNYTEANGIIFEFNRFGPLRTGCLGNNLKDRSAGTVIRYNWIEGGNRQLDLVDSSHLNTDSDYAATFVYGNVLIEPDGAGNSQIIHYGGDSGTTSQYRKGTVHFYNNTVISTRTGNTTLFRLSTNDESCDLRNNIVYVSAAGNRLAWLDAAGALSLRNCWFKTGAVSSHSGLTGSITDAGSHVNGTVPGFVDYAAQDFSLLETSDCLNAGADLHAGATSHPLSSQYVPPQEGVPRPTGDALDLGAFEFPPPKPPSPIKQGGSCGLTGFEGLMALALLALVRRRCRRIL